jgi:hypothetical protein
MQDNVLKTLVEEADVRSQSAGGNPAEVAAQVRVVHGRRRRRRLAAIATAFVLLGCLLRRLAPNGPAPQVAKPSPDVAIMKEIAAVAFEQSPRVGMEQIAREERMVHRLLVVERARRLANEAERLSERRSPTSREEQVAVVAAGHLVSGDFKRAAGLPVASARNDYTRVVELFPDTIWADQAKARLASF